METKVPKINLARYVNCISLKFTAQQCGKDLNTPEDEQIATIREIITRVCKAQNSQVIGICHYGEQISTYNNGYEVENIKVHAHMMVRVSQRTTILSVLSKLEEYGIEFDRQRDRDLLGEIKVINLQKHMNAFEYYNILHQTEAAIEDGKRVYEESEVITNLSDEQISQLKECYKKNFVSMDSDQVNLSKTQEKASWIELFFQYGEQGNNIDALLSYTLFGIFCHLSLLICFCQYYSSKSCK